MYDERKHKFTVYVRSTCHLCDDMLVILNDYLDKHSTAYSLDVIDVSKNIKLEKKYGQFVPVLHESGNEICHYFFDDKQWREYFS